ncbi:Small-conductance mechanosensitive channel [Sphingobacterium nematocida]|uniref:Small-conductance mechanosensitive channel n=1 Tax=Sphingobacterium nematocida TaxID=1513896 RepID=A0A1T5BZ55_9SPHI|nr:mechanosensitive ion channel domain-containing protein [Sphingobacterium nematocida]SKB52628.1 Small-conductance mechanosensitive channel [Sphingobacterium nematocida]
MIEKTNTSKFPFTFVIKIILLAITITLFFNVTKEDETMWWYQVLRGVYFFLVPSIVVSIARFVIISFYNARHAKVAVRGNFVLGINRLTAMLNAVFVIIALMIAFGIKPIEFLTSLTIVAMAIAVLFRDYITNMLSGLFIMFSEQLSVGDRIKVGDQKGRIVDITFANIELQNDEDDIVMIPNNLVFTNPMVNLSAHRSNLFTVKFELPLAIPISVDQLESDIRSTLTNHPNLAPTNELDLEVVEIGKDFVRYKIELYAVSSSNKLHKSIENEILKYILDFKHRQAKSF